MGELFLMAPRFYGMDILGKRRDSYFSDGRAAWNPFWVVDYVEVQKQIIQQNRIHPRKPEYLYWILNKSFAKSFLW